MAVASVARWSLLPLLVALAPATHARPITIEFEGVVTGAMDWFLVLPEVPIGSAVAGSYWYEEDDAEVDHGAATGSVEFALKSKYAGFEFTVADSTYRFSNASDPDGPLAIAVADGEYRVSWTGSARSLFGTPALVEERITDEIRLSILGEGIESSSLEAIPLPPALAGRRAEFHFAARRDERPFSARPISVQSGFRATITTMRVVSEPTTLALLGAAFAAVLVARAGRAGAGP